MAQGKMYSDKELGDMPPARRRRIIRHRMAQRRYARRKAQRELIEYVLGYRRHTQ